MGVIQHVGSGKVREIYRIGDDRLLLVATDRISAYDVILPQPIPGKGKVLTGMSHFWFSETSHLCPNHEVAVQGDALPDVGLDDLPGRAMLCRRAEPVPVEFVVRGFLSGSGWVEYQESGAVCGHRLPEGLVESDALPEAILTPATKATSGHDINITESEAAEIAGRDVYEAARSHALAIYSFAAERARAKGVIIADTKFEFGAVDGEVILIDEALTPDSSRFWPADRYRPGGTQPSFDKQYVRDWLNSIDWDRTPPPPDLPTEVVGQTAARYAEAYERVTGERFESWLQEVGA